MLFVSSEQSSPMYSLHFSINNSQPLQYEQNFMNLRQICIENQKICNNSQNEMQNKYNEVDQPYYLPSMNLFNYPLIDYSLNKSILNPFIEEVEELEYQSIIEDRSFQRSIIEDHIFENNGSTQSNGNQMNQSLFISHIQQNGKKKINETINNKTFQKPANVIGIQKVDMINQEEIFEEKLEFLKVIDSQIDKQNDQFDQRVPLLFQDKDSDCLIQKKIYPQNISYMNDIIEIANLSTLHSFNQQNMSTDLIQQQNSHQLQDQYQVKDLNNQKCNYQENQSESILSPLSHYEMLQKENLMNYNHDQQEFDFRFLLEKEDSLLDNLQPFQFDENKVSQIITPPPTPTYSRNLNKNLLDEETFNTALRKTQICRSHSLNDLLLLSQMKCQEYQEEDEEEKQSNNKFENINEEAIISSNQSNIAIDIQNIEIQQQQQQQQQNLSIEPLNQSNLSLNKMDIINKKNQIILDDKANDRMNYQEESLCSEKTILQKMEIQSFYQVEQSLKQQKQLQKQQKSRQIQEVDDEDDISKIDKKNIVRNLLRAFVKFLFNKSRMPEPLKEFDGNRASEIKSSFKKSFSKKRYNNSSIKQLVQHNIFGKIFKFYLENESRTYLKKSCVKGKEAHQKFIQYLISCFHDINQLQKLETYSKFKY